MNVCMTIWHTCISFLSRKIRHGTSRSKWTIFAGGDSEGKICVLPHAARHTKITDTVNINVTKLWVINTLRPSQNGLNFTDDMFKWIFLNGNIWMSNRMSLELFPRGAINIIPTLVQIMAWCRPGDELLSEPMMVRWPAHIWVIRPQWACIFRVCKNLLISPKSVTFATVKNGMSCSWH